MNKGKDPYKVLGISQDAGKDEIKNRYNVLLKKIASQKKESEKIQLLEESTLAEITWAYHELMGIEQSEASGGTQTTGKKIESFFYYHKVHMLVGVILTLFVAYMLYGIITKDHTDFTVSLVGEFPNQNKTLEERIKANLPDIGEVQVDVVEIAPTSVEKMGYGDRVKYMAVAADETIDILIMSSALFDSFSKSDALQNLDDVVRELGLDKAENQNYALKMGGKGHQSIYGIQIKNSKILKETKITEEDIVVGIKKKARQRDLAVQFIGLLLKEP